MQHLFRQLPAIDKLLKAPQAVEFIENFGYSAVVREMRKLIEHARQTIQQTQTLPDFLTDESALFALVEFLSKI